MRLGQLLSGFSLAPARGVERRQAIRVFPWAKFSSLKAGDTCLMVRNKPGPENTDAIERAHQ